VSKNAIRKAIAILVILFLVYGLAGLYAAHDSVLQAVKNVPWKILPQIIGLVMLGWLLRALRWHYYTRVIGWKISLPHNLHAFFAGSALTATPGKAGELLKSSLLQTIYPVSITDGAGLLLVERLTDLLAVILLAVGGFNLLPTGKTYFILCCLSIIAGVVLLSCKPLCALMLNPLTQLKFIGPIALKVEKLLIASRQVLAPAPLLIGLGIALVAWSCEALALFQLFTACHIAISLTAAGCLFGASTLVGALSFLPGGIGSFEAVMLLMLTHLGTPAKLAMPPIILFRVLTLWLACLVGVVLFFLWPLTQRSHGKQKS
jgi:uncharacterized membrane protein YbhN (UPF0104 family)